MALRARDVLLFAIVTWLGASLARAEPSYVAVPIGTLGGTASYGAAINERGDIAGFSYLPRVDPTTYSFIPGNSIWVAMTHSNGAMRDLGLPRNGPSSTTGINESGQMSGFGPTATSLQHALKFSNGVAIEAGPPDAKYSRATGINDAGQVVGFAEWWDPPAMHAFIYADGVVRDIHSIGLVSSGAAINAAGHATGTVHFGSSGPDGLVIDYSRAFLYRDGVTIALGTLGGGYSVGNAINDSDQVAGESDSGTTPAYTRAVVFSEGTVIDLGTLGGMGSWARGINNHGHVVGNSDVARNSYRAFLHDGTKMRDLNELVVSGLDGVVLMNAVAINDKGQITAYACLELAMCQAFRLDPLPASGEKLLVVEYHHAVLDHYFLTGDPVEIDALDRGLFSGWARTGESFEMLSRPVVGAAPLCRFFSAAFGQKGSHFYTPATSECMWVNGNPNWTFEGVRLYTMRPARDGSCAPGTRPVYRVYNDGQGGAPAHRNTTSLAVRSSMIAAGWVAEGSGPDGVGMCVPE